MENNRPKHFLILKLVGFLGVAIAILGFILIFTGFGDFESNKFTIGIFVVPFGLFIGVVGLVSGFRPEITKTMTKSVKYIQSQNKQDLTDIASTNAEIISGAVQKTAEAVKQGFAEEKMFCKHCGAQIDADSTFCNRCGKQQ